MVSHLKITQAGLVSALTFVVGQLAAFVPSISAAQQVLVSAGTAVIAAVFLIANAIHALASSKHPPVYPAPAAVTSSTGKKAA